MKEPESLQDAFLSVVKLHCKRFFDLLMEIDIHPGQEHVLMILLAEDGQSQKDITKRLKIKPATVTVMIQRMEKNGLVRKEQDKKDQRISRVFITEKGREICEKAKKIKKQVEEECFGNFTIEERVLFRRFLLQVRENLLATGIEDEGCSKRTGGKE